jgi:hypothetical protein
MPRHGFRTSRTAAAPLLRRGHDDDAGPNWYSASVGGAFDVTVVSLVLTQPVALHSRQSDESANA